MRFWGETADGGFYLIGLRTSNKKIFADVEWSSAATFEQTAANIKNTGLKLSLIPDWFDVDLPADLVELQKTPPADQVIAPKTFQWLNNNMLTTDET